VERLPSLLPRTASSKSSCTFSILFSMERTVGTSKSLSFKEDDAMPLADSEGSDDSEGSESSETAKSSKLVSRFSSPAGSPINSRSSTMEDSSLGNSSVPVFNIESSKSSNFLTSTPDDITCGLLFTHTPYSSNSSAEPMLLRSEYIEGFFSFTMSRSLIHIMFNYRYFCLISIGSINIICYYKVILIVNHNDSLKNNRKYKHENL